MEWIIVTGLIVLVIGQVVISKWRKSRQLFADPKMSGGWWLLLGIVLSLIGLVTAVLATAWPFIQIGLEVAN